MSERDLRGYRYKVRVRIGECEVELEQGRVAPKPPFEGLRAAAIQDVLQLRELERTLPREVTSLEEKGMAEDSHAESTGQDP